MKVLRIFVKITHCNRRALKRGKKESGDEVEGMEQERKGSDKVHICLEFNLYHIVSYV